MALSSGLIASRVAKGLTDGGWKAATGGKPPQDPADPDTDWSEAIIFALVSGSIMALAKLMAKKQAAHVYTRTTGRSPLSANGKAS